MVSHPGCSCSWPYGWGGIGAAIEPTPPWYNHGFPPQVYSHLAVVKHLQVISSCFWDGGVFLPSLILVSSGIHWILGPYRTHYTLPFQLVTLLATWWTSEFVCLPVKGLVAPGIRPSHFGSSGTFVRKLSSLNLKSSNPHLDIFLMWIRRPGQSPWVQFYYEVTTATSLVLVHLSLLWNSANLGLKL